MLPLVQGSGESKRLVEIFTRLGTQDRASLIAFAEFLLARASAESMQEDPFPAEPLQIARPDRESVVGAMRRLSEAYFMVDKSVVLHEASSLMGAHVTQGRPAPEVIDELEALFRQAYDHYLDQQ